MLLLVNIFGAGSSLDERSTTDDQRREASFIVPLLVLLWSKGNQVSACLSVI